MTARLIALSMLGAFFVSCSPAPASGDPMSITDVIANIDELNGQEIRVAGYLGECGGYDCPLFRSAEEKAQADRYLNGIRASRQSGGERPSAALEPPWLGIGSGENFAFDRKAAPYANSYVVITGRVTNMCRYNGQPGCTDRSTDLVPTDIAHWSPTTPAGTPTK